MGAHHTVTCAAPTAGLQTGTAGPAACRAPGYRPENSLSGNPLLSWRPARISVFRVPPWGRQLETFFRVCPLLPVHAIRDRGERRGQIRGGGFGAGPEKSDFADFFVHQNIIVHIFSKA